MKINVELFKQNPAWDAVLFVARELQSRGHVAYLAGGSVRDAILGKRPKDFDIATSAQPHEVEQIFEKTVAVGKAFGVIVVMVEGSPDGEGPIQKFSFEVATFRADGLYKDGRRPETVTYSSPEKDAERRDFTINSLFFDLKTEKVIDFCKGMIDIEARVIRAVGEPSQRFAEDKLRMLRAVRFAGQLGFKIEPQTLAAIKHQHSEISVVSPERVTDELDKIWQSQDAVYSFILLHETGLIHHVLRGFHFYKDSRWLKFYLQGLDQASGDSLLLWRWLALCESLSRGVVRASAAKTKLKDTEPSNNSSADAGDISDVLKVFLNFKLSKEVMTSIDFCLRHYADFEKRDTEALILLDHKNGPGLLQLASLQRKLLGDIKFYAEFVERYRSLSGGDGFLHAPLLNGRDIESLGVPKSPKVGELLKAVYKAQLEGQVKDRDKALAWVKKAMSR